ncbi:MAG: hypothetical protein M0R02_14830, partial [Bacteroidales bacterium]|nr:hypothetical protein [Bacteroidales bacterium]
DEDWQTARQAILDSAQHHCGPYLEKARGYMQRISERRGLDMPSVEPRITMQTPTAGEIHLVVRVPARPNERSLIEQAILMDAFGAKADT